MSNIGIAYKFAYNLSPCNKISAVSPSQPDIQQLKLRALRLPLAAFHLCPWQLLMCFSQDAIRDTVIRTPVKLLPVPLVLVSFTLKPAMYILYFFWNC